MATAGETMICPQCGDEMNHHADKLVEPTSAAEVRQIDPALGGIVEETHGCPGCGAVASRRPALRA
jgi:ribosomal protein S27AE